MAVELFANQVTTTVSSGGTTAPSAGTSETWTVASSTGFPAASSTATPPTFFRVSDTATAASGEKMIVTNVSGTTWTVTRGAEGSTVAHTSGFTVQQVITAAGMAAAGQSGGTLVQKIAPLVAVLTASSGTVAVNAALANSFNYTVAAATTISNPTNPTDGQVIRFRVTSGGNFATIWGTAYDFGTGTAPVLSTTSGKLDMIAFEYAASISKWIYLGSGLGY